MADSTIYQNLETIVAHQLSIHVSDLAHLAELLLADCWTEEQVQDYGYKIDRSTLTQALLNVITAEFEAMLKSWSAEDWLRGGLGTELQTEIKHLGETALDLFQIRNEGV